MSIRQHTLDRAGGIGASTAAIFFSRQRPFKDIRNACGSRRLPGGVLLRWSRAASWGHAADAAAACVKRDLEYAKRDLEYAKRDLECAKRDLEYAKRDLEYAKRSL